ncbi:MAG: hypothetical protein GYB65_23420 [Chloroflexi bacterium]|nr:hypothetical protein [Chloroflexota bacterium]
MPNASFLSRYLLPLLVIMAFGVIGAVLAEASSPAQGNPPVDDEPAECQACHQRDVVPSWAEGVHARTWNDPDLFLDIWRDNGENQACLACHTTGYNAVTGNYDHVGIGCEACHGETPANHPEEPVPAPSAEVCASCHSTTFDEWSQSMHAQLTDDPALQAACLTCHYPHPQQLRILDPERVVDLTRVDGVVDLDLVPPGQSNLICINCHNQDDYEDETVAYAHVQHTALGCETCHWFGADLGTSLASSSQVSELPADHFQTGALQNTGHSGMVETVACLDCHLELNVAELEGEPLASLVTDTQLHRQQVRIEELEAEVDTVKAQGSNTSALRMAQGLVIGVVVGGIVIFVAGRFNRSNPQPHDDEQQVEQEE